jgi:hypothetical protein
MKILCRSRLYSASVSSTDAPADSMLNLTEVSFEHCFNTVYDSFGQLQGMLLSDVFEGARRAQSSM